MANNANVCLIITIIILNVLDAYLHDPVFERQRLCDDDETFCRVGVCTVPECDICNKKLAYCKTDNATQPVPQTLDKRIQQLTIDYQGLATGLSSKSFELYVHLSSVHITGRVSSLAPGTFRDHQYLHNLRLSHSLITSLPDHLFYSMSSLVELYLPYNKLGNVPENVFYEIKRLSTLDISYNPIDLCAVDTIGERFQTMPNLQNLLLKGLGGHERNNCSFHQNFLTPISHVRNIDLSESYILQGNEVIVQALTQTQQLTIDNMDMYKTCPVKANALLAHIPTNMKTIVARFWKTEKAISVNCSLNSTSFSYLSERGSKLTGLDFSYSDKILSDHITPTSFAGLSLRRLDLSWCRIVSIEDGAFDSHPQLSLLSLSGNQLGPRNINLFTEPKFGNYLNELNLDRVDMFSDEQFQYNLGNIMRVSPNISELFLSDNMMTKLPSFVGARGTASTDNVSKRYNVITINLNNNRLTDFSISGLSELCSMMPALQTFRAAYNKIVDVTGLCRSITHLTLNNNNMGENLERNFESLRGMVSLYFLDIAQNGIQSIPANTFVQMASLRSLILAGNEITSVPHNSFSHNPHLTLLDLSANEITSVDYSMFQYSEYFVWIYLQSNLISNMTQEVIKRIKHLSIKRNIYGKLWTKLEMLDISGNPIDCTCSTGNFQKWVQTSTVIADIKNLTCGNSDANRESNFVLDYKYSEFYCIWRTKAVIAGFALLALLIFLPLGICIYKHSWYIRHIRVVCTAITRSAQRAKVDQSCTYDAFISYDTQSERDICFVRDILIPQLEGVGEEEADRPEQISSTEEKVTLYIHDRDARLGAERFTTMCQAVEDSRKLIILLSNSYLGSDACLSEAYTLAGYETDRTDCYHPERILILVLEDPNDEIVRPPITALLKGNVIEMTDRIRRSQQKLSCVLGRIRKFISKPKYSYKRKSKRKRERTATRVGGGQRERYTYQSISQA